MLNALVDGGGPAQMKGSMSRMRCPDPGAFERAQYARSERSGIPARISFAGARATVMEMLCHGGNG
jgi:hypothetical protein